MHLILNTVVPLVAILLLTINAGQASDQAKEKRWADQIVDSLMVGDAQWLEAGKDKFLALYAEHTADDIMGGALILHGIGVHPNWPEVIHPLRSQLPEYGWTTLSLQMPILPNESTVADYAPLFAEVPARIETGIDFLKSKGIENIVIIAHSLGAAMASYYLSENPDKAVLAFVGIGMNKNDDKKRMDNATSLGKIKIPVLDLYGANDLEGVMASVQARANAAKRAGNKHYRQLKIEGADHFFNNMDEVLIKRIRGWLANHAAGTELKP